MKTFVDLSHLNPITSLQDLKNSGIFGVILKGQQGITYQDPMYAQRMQEMRNSGIPILGEYLYYMPEDDPGKQAQNVVENCQGIKTVIIDLEWMSGTQAWLGTEYENEANLKVLIGLLVTAGFDVKIYTSHAFIIENLSSAAWLADYDLWLAYYGAAPVTLPPMWTKVWAWQYTAQGSIPGVSGFVDISYLNDGTIPLSAT